MTAPSDRFSRLESLFARCADASPAEIDAILGAGDVSFDLAREVRALLASSQTATGAPRMPELHRGGAHDTANPRPDLAGRTLGRYRLIEEIRTGGMGTIHLAEDLGLGRQVAVKTMRSGGHSHEMVERFRREAAVLAGLQHPNIATIHGADLAIVDGEEIPWLAMELVAEARPIDVWTRETGATRDETLRTFRSVLDAVHHAHVRGVIHRDLKPSNILMDSTGQPKLIDFGIARRLQDEARSLQTAEGAVLGTPRYMSPEQCRGESALADTRSDIFSAGVVLYELVTGAHPFAIHGKSTLEAMRIMAETRASSARSTSSMISRDLDAVLSKALASDPAGRYQSAAEFSDDLGRVLGGDPVEARRLSISRLIRSRARRHPGIAVATTMAVLAVSIGLVYGSIMTTRVYQASLRGQRYIDTLLQILQHESIRDRGGDATVADALDAMSAAADQLDREEDRGNRADLQMVLAHAYDHLGLHDRAMDAAREVVRLRSLVSGEHSPETLEARMVLLQFESETTRRNPSVVGAELLPAEQRSLAKLVEEHREILGDDHPQTRAALMTLARSIVLELPEQELQARRLRDILGDDAGIQIAYAALGSAWDEYEAAGPDVTVAQLLRLIDRMESAERVAAGVRPEPLLLLMVHNLMISTRPILRDDPEHGERVLAMIDRLDDLCERTRTGNVELDAEYLRGYSSWTVERFRSESIDKRLTTLLDLNRPADVLRVWEQHQASVLPGESWCWGTRWAAYAAARLGDTAKERELLEAIIDHARNQTPPLDDIIESCTTRLMKIAEASSPTP